MSTYCRILIVEDEYLTRQGIKGMIHWEQEGFQIVGEASNGEEALARIEELKPQIVLTDVVMPVMDGIALTQAIQERYPETRVIVLSGYSDFEYVKSIFQHGAVDYILKPTLNQQELLATLCKAAGQIPDFVLTRGGGDSFESVINQALSGFPAPDALEKLRKVFPYPHFFLVGMNVPYVLGNAANLSREAGILAAGAEEFLPGVTARVATIDRKFLLMIVNYAAEPYRSLTERVRKLVASVRVKSPRAFYVYTREFSGLGLLKETYTRLAALSRQRFYCRDVFIQGEDAFAPAAAEPFDAARFNALIRASDMRQALEQLDAWLRRAVDRHAPGEFELKSLVQDALYQMLAFWEESGMDAERIASLKRDCFIRISEAKFAEDLLEAFGCIRADFLTLFEEWAPRQGKRSVQEILDYVEEHCAEALTLNDVAKRFNFNYSYLSSYFSANSREGFSEYLNRARIRRAEELLRKGDIPVSEVCGMVGYGDHSYFCKVFKKFTGKTPSEFRRQCGAAVGGKRWKKS